ncbi:MAG: TonB-dependent receptor [Flavobacteriales bacterium]
MVGSNYLVVLTPEPFPLDEVVISAHRWEQEAERVPERITVIKPRDVAFNNPSTAADMLEQSGEVFVQRSQLGGGSPMLRGFAANRLLIVLDGVRMNNAIYRAGNLQNVISIDPEAISGAEVLHGPGAMTYGSDAIGGVMDFHLLAPRFAKDSTTLRWGGATARYASAAHASMGHAHVGIGGRVLAFVGSLSYDRFADLRTGSHGPADYLRPWSVKTINGRDSVIANPDPRIQLGSGYHALMTMAKMAYRPMQHLEIGINGYYSTTGDVPRYDRLIELRPNGLPRSAQWYYGPQVWRMASLTLKHEAQRGPWSKARIILAYQDYEESRNDRSFRSTNFRTQQEHVTGFWANLDLEKEWGKRTQILYGAEYVTNTVASKGITGNINTGEEQRINSRYPDGSRWSTAALYLGVMHDATERITLSAGVRGNTSALDCTFDTTLFPYPALSTSLRNSAITGNVGVSFRPDATWKFSADLRTGFRAPNVDDIGKVFDSEPGAVIVPNPDLAPEYAYGAECGVAKVWADRLRVEAGTYYLLLDRAMVRRPFTLNGQDSIMHDGERSRVDAIVNAAQARVHGFHLGVDLCLTSQLTLEVKYSWQRGVEQDDGSTTDVPLRHAPPPFGRAGLKWQRKKLQLAAVLRWSDGFTYEQLPPSEQAKTPLYARDANGLPYAPEWHVIDFRGAYQLSPAIQFTTALENVTDQRYRSYSSGISAPGRQVVLAVRAHF